MENKLFITTLLTLFGINVPGLANLFETQYNLPAPFWFLTFATIFCATFIGDKVYKLATKKR